MPSDTTAEKKPPLGNTPKVRLPIDGRLLLVIAAIVGYLLWTNLKEFTNPHELSVSGRLEGYETNLSPKIGGRVAFIKYREGDPVKIGEVVARLNDEDYQAQLRGSLARIAKAKQQVSASEQQLKVFNHQISGAEQHLSQAKEETSAQIEQAESALREADSRYKQTEAELQQAKSHLNLTGIRLKRYTDLVKRGAVTKDEYDQAATNFTSDTKEVDSKEASMAVASHAVKTAKAALTRATALRHTPPIRSFEISALQSQLDQATEQLAAAKTEVQNAEADRDQILANLGYLQLTSPVNGVVTARPVEPGAVMSPGQTVLTVLDYSEVYLRGYVPEGDVGKVRIGQKVTLHLDAMPKRSFSGKVIEIDPEGSFTPENIYFKNDRVKQVFGIKVSIDKPEGFAKPGMPADAIIELQ